MSLVECPVCKNKVSKRAVTCPNCGEPDPVGYNSRNALLGRMFWLCIWAAVIAVVWYKVVPSVIELINSL